MKKLHTSALTILAIAYFMVATANAQIPDNTNGRLYHTCKTWGYLKYFSQNKCSIKWDTLLHTTINQVLLSANNAEFNDALMGMFSKVGNNSFRANPPAKPDTNLNVDNSWIKDTLFSQPVRDFLDTFSTNIYPDTSICFIKPNDFSNPNYTSFIDFRNDPLSMSIGYTQEAHRLTTMFYYWNVINYFSPYKHIMDQSWDSTLFEFIPLMRQATTEIEFQKTFLKLVSKIKDTHGFTSIYVLYGGDYLPKIYFTRVNNQCVVTKVDGVLGVHQGDILTAINGVSMKEIEDSLAQFLPSSTPAALYRDIYDIMSFGAVNSVLIYTFLDSNNNTFTTPVTRSIRGPAWYSWSRNPGVSSSYFITNCGYGYVNMGLLKIAEVPAMFEKLKGAPAIIFDIRNYPNGTISDLAKYFFTAPIISAIWFQPSMTLAGWYDKHDDHNNFGNWTTSNTYSGKMYLLVNQETQSHAEYTCQYLSYFPNAKVIGTQTAGADGDISYLDLPGGISTYFSSLGWYYADGYQQQRKGVKIDSIVSPTIVGIRHGEDEILNAALDCITGLEEGNANRNSTQIPQLDISPNPTNGIFTVKGIPENTIQISFQNILGESVLEVANPHSAQFSIDLSNQPSGVYLVRFVSAAGAITETRKLVIER